MSVSTADFRHYCPLLVRTASPTRRGSRFGRSGPRSRARGTSVWPSFQSGGTLKGTNRGRVPSVVLAAIDHLMGCGGHGGSDWTGSRWRTRGGLVADFWGFPRVCGRRVFCMGAVWLRSQPDASLHANWLPCHLSPGATFGGSVLCWLRAPPICGEADRGAGLFVRPCLYFAARRCDSGAIHYVGEQRMRV